MNVQMIGRLAGILALTVGLAGCIDMTMDVKVKNESEADATMIQTISAQFYPMIKASAKSDSGSSGSSDDFCKKDDGGTLVENADGSATCTITKSGKFADLGFDNGKEEVKFASAGPGLVKVSFPTAEFSKGLDEATSGAAAGGSDATSQDAESKAAEAQMKAAMTAYFAGHFLTIKIEGGEITDSNMTIAADRQSAEQKIALTDLISGTAKLPAELYAVVKVQ